VMFLMPAGAGGFLQAMWRRIWRGRREIDAPAPVERVSQEVVSGMQPAADPKVATGRVVGQD
jgi:hypothetical protein